MSRMWRRALHYTDRDCVELNSCIIGSLTERIRDFSTMWNLSWLSRTCIEMHFQYTYCSCLSFFPLLSSLLSHLHYLVENLEESTRFCPAGCSLQHVSHRRDPAAPCLSYQHLSIHPSPPLFFCLPFSTSNRVNWSSPAASLSLTLNQYIMSPLPRSFFIILPTFINTVHIALLGDPAQVKRGWGHRV